MHMYNVYINHHIGNEYCKQQDTRESYGKDRTEEQEKMVKERTKDDQ